MLILVSNDDGISSKGIKVLAHCLKKIPKARVVVVAPDREQSAASHALTLHRPLRIEKVGRDQYTVNGTPTDAVTLGVRTILKTMPDLIVSGINKGANLGEDVHYSGTVSAAMEGAIMGIPGIAISLVNNGNKLNFGVSADFAKKLSIKVLKEGLPKGIMLNVNVPNISLKEVNGYAITFLGKHNYGDVIIKNTDPRGKAYYWIGGDPNQFDEKPGSDCHAYLEKKISITPIKADMTDKEFFKKINKWKI